jgi:hypothetical protein
MTTRAPILFDVPAGTRSTRCASCNKVIYFILTPAGKRMPVDCDVEGGNAPSSRGSVTQFHGRGVSHFATCAHADEHRRPR